MNFLLLCIFRDYFLSMRNAIRCVYSDLHLWFLYLFFYLMKWYRTLSLSLAPSAIHRSPQESRDPRPRPLLFNLERLSFSSRDCRSRDRTLITRVQESKFPDSRIKSTCMWKYRCRVLYHIIMASLCWDEFSLFAGEWVEHRGMRKRDLLQRRTGWQWRSAVDLPLNPMSPSC